MTIGYQVCCGQFHPLPYTASYTAPYTEHAPSDRASRLKIVSSRENVFIAFHGTLKVEIMIPILNNFGPEKMLQLEVTRLDFYKSSTDQAQAVIEAVRQYFSFRWFNSTWIIMMSAKGICYCLHKTRIHLLFCLPINILSV